MKVVSVWLALMLCASPLAAAHDLDLTTAQVTLRGERHIAIRVEADVAKLAGHLDWPDKPSTLLDMGGASDDQLAALRGAIEAQFTTGMPVQVGGREIQSQRVRPVDLNLLRRKIQSAIAYQILPKGHAHRDDDQDRRRFIIIHVDGFISPAADDRNLQIDFPAALGRISVTYNRPRTQTLAAGDVQTRYLEHLD